MRTLVFRLPTTLTQCFRGTSLVFQILAIVLTYILVTTGVDWSYFLATRDALLRQIFFPAIIVGGLLPVFGPLGLLWIGHFYKNLYLKNSAWALGQAAFLGWTVSSTYKVFTGRLQPNLENITVDISHAFRFGIFRGGAFWGWPSSHTTIAFAMAVTIGWLYRKHRIVPVLALIYAVYIGAGVATVGTHWLSEAVAGTLLGVVIGRQVSKNFESRISAEQK